MQRTTLPMVLLVPLQKSFIREKEVNVIFRTSKWIIVSAGIAKFFIWLQSSDRVARNSD